MLINIIYLLIADIIWGSAFVAQHIGGELVGPYTFNGIRCLIGFLVLIPIALILRGKRQSKKTKEEWHNLIKGGIVCGIALFFASNLQQVGINMGASVGKAGFLTACYIIMVPLIGLLRGQKCGKNVIVGVALALVGLWFMCMKKSDFNIALPDLLLLGCALMFAVQILAVSHYGALCNAVELSCFEFLVAGLITIIPMFFSDMNHSLSGMVQWADTLKSMDAWLAILYAGVLSCGVAYTCQIKGQQGIDPAVASLIMSMESVFSLISGWIILGERLSTREFIGCALVLAAVIVAQVNPFMKKTRSRE